MHYTPCQLPSSPILLTFYLLIVLPTVDGDATTAYHEHIPAHFAAVRFVALDVLLLRSAAVCITRRGVITIPAQQHAYADLCGSFYGLVGSAGR